MTYACVNMNVHVVYVCVYVHVYVYAPLHVDVRMYLARSSASSFAGDLARLKLWHAYFQSPLAAVTQSFIVVTLLGMFEIKWTPYP